MKAYQVNNLLAKIEKQEGIIKAIERNLNFEGIKAYKAKQLNERLQKEINVLNYMKKQLA